MRYVTCSDCNRVRPHCCHGRCSSCNNRRRYGGNRPRHKCPTCDRQTSLPGACSVCAGSMPHLAGGMSARPTHTYRHGVEVSTCLDPHAEQAEKDRRVEIYIQQFERWGKLNFADPRLHAGPAPARYLTLTEDDQED